MKTVHEAGAPLADSSFADYRALTPAAFRAAKSLARRLKDLPVIHVNSTAIGGGVAELLKSQVAYEKELGLGSHWLVVKAPRSFFRVTKKIHNLLQGRSGGLSARELAEYLSLQRQARHSLAGFLKPFGKGIVVLHDPQALPLVADVPPRFAAVSRLHIDLTSPNPVMLDALKPLLKKCDKVIASNRVYAGNLPWVPKSKFSVIYPAIDPFSDKNRSLNPAGARAALKKVGIDPKRPLLAQVSRFDRWKDPLGVVDVYRIAKKAVPDLQLVLSGLMLAHDDPEAEAVFAEVKKHANRDKDIFLFEDAKRLRGVPDETFVGAIYTASTVMIQKSLREGFGLTMTEAMWKGKALVAGKNSGALAQMTNRRNGLIAASTEKAAEDVIELLKNPKLRERLGRAAQETVRRRFLMSRFVVDNLKLYASLKK